MEIENKNDKTVVAPDLLIKKKLTVVQILMKRIFNSGLESISMTKDTKNLWTSLIRGVQELTAGPSTQDVEVDNDKHIQHYMFRSCEIGRDIAHIYGKSRWYRFYLLSLWVYKENIKK